MRKKKIAHLNTVASGGAISNLIQMLSEGVSDYGYSTRVYFGRGPRPTYAVGERVGWLPSQATDLLLSRLFDRAGQNSVKATESLLNRFRTDRPDIVHVHNIHGYWVNQSVLFRGLSDLGIPVVWTLHDYWPLTGHCAYFEMAGCTRWRSGCGACPQTRSYPKAFFDRSAANYLWKRHIYDELDNLNIVAVSHHARKIVGESLLARFPISTIYNAVDTGIFRPSSPLFNSCGAFVVGSVARNWDERKGLADVVRLRSLLDASYQIVVVGLSRSQAKKLPGGMIGMPATNSREELAAIYSSMDVFFNPSREETFGLTTVEAMACGVPVVLYDVSANREIQPAFLRSGIVELEHLDGAAEAVRALAQTSGQTSKQALLKHVDQNFSRPKFVRRYVEVYEKASKR